MEYSKLTNPASELIIGRTRSFEVGRPLQARLIEEESRNKRPRSSHSCVDSHWLPGGVEDGVWSHGQTPGEVVAKVKESIVEVLSVGRQVGGTQESFAGNVFDLGEDAGGDAVSEVCQELWISDTYTSLKPAPVWYEDLGDVSKAIKSHLSFERQKLTSTSYCTGLTRTRPIGSRRSSPLCGGDTLRWC